MKSLLIGCIAATTLGIATAAAQSTNNATPNAAATPQSTAAAQNDAGAAAASGEFIAQQQTGLVRAPKLVGVAVYGPDNKSIGKVADVLLDHDGVAKVVVIGVGGFLGIGSKDVGLPYSAVHWQTEQRTVATNGNDAVGGGAPAGGTLAEKGQPTPNAQNTQTIPAAQTEAYQGYPDRAVVDFTQAQLKAAPEFKYAQNPEAKMTTPAGGATPAATKTP